ncbi:MAG: methyl-accepting chemotaxis protein [Lachnospiraceae bacterium]|nr:methyl-accepting chemotaxis protein [Lachnospiraceae bacterium]
MKTKIKLSGIAGKTLLPILAIIVMLVLTAVINISSNVEIAGELDELADKTFKGMRVANQIRFDVLHTAELFTDASATQDVEVYEEAEEVRDEMLANLELVKSYDVDEGAAKYWDGIKSDYLAFYAKAQEMAEAYINEGLDAGNAVMEEIDVISEELSEIVDGAVEKFEERMKDNLAEVENDSRNLLIISIVTSAISIILGVVIAVIILRQVIGPVSAVNESLGRLADHDLTVKSLKTTQKDEIGNLTESYNKLRESLREIMNNMDDSTGKLEQVSVTMAEESDTIVKNVSEITNAVNSVAESANKQTAEVENSMSQLDSLLEVAQRNLESSEKLSAASDQISEASRNGNRVLDDLYKVTKESESAFAHIFESIESIMKSTEKISDASNMIENIAGQTNLLSLNAAIEAARAGDVGRGFAVVADEIRTLSDDSQRSVNEINQMIQELQANVDKANQEAARVKEFVAKQTKGVDDTKESYKAISDNLDVINDEIGTLGGISKSMTENCKAVGDSVTHLSAEAQENAAATEEISASIQEVMAMTEDISSGTQDIKTKAGDLEKVVKLYRID